MKKIANFIVISILIFAAKHSFTQELQVIFNDPINYPIVGTGFHLYDTDKKEIRNEPNKILITSDDIFIEEYDKTTLVIKHPLADPYCPDKTLKTFSAILTVDISESMGDGVSTTDLTPKIDIVKKVLKKWVKDFDPKRCETAITIFGNDAHGKNLDHKQIFQPFTIDKNELNMSIDEISAKSKGTDYNTAFIKANDNREEFSALYYCKPSIRKYKPVIIFLTDGKHSLSKPAFLVDTVIKRSLALDVTIYVIHIGTEVLSETNKSNLRRLADETKIPGDITPNYWFDIQDADKLSGTYDEILEEAANDGYPPPCYIDWETVCTGGSATISLPKWNVSKEINFSIDPDKKPYFDISPNNIQFKNISPANNKKQIIRLTAKKNYIDILSDNHTESLSIRGLGRYSVTDWGMFNGKPVTLPFRLPKDSAIFVELTYTALDSLYSKAVIELTGSACSGNNINASAEMLPFVEKIDMGDVPVNNTESKTFTQVFCNKTGKKIVIDFMRISGLDKDDFSIIYPKGSFEIDSGACIEIAFSFKPQKAGPETAQIEIKTDYGTGDTFKGTIIGNGLGDKTITSINPGFDSASCNKMQVETIILLKNSGPLPLNNIKCSILPNSDNYEIKGSVISSIPVDGEVPVKILFHPTALRNTDYTAILKVESDAENNPYEIPLSGPMRNVDFTLSKSLIDFAEVCVNETKTEQFDIKNTGNVDLMIDLNMPLPFSVNSSSFIIAPGDSNTVNIQCSPIEDGVKTGTVIIGNLECEIPYNLDLNTVGVKPLISLDKNLDLYAVKGNIGKLDVTLTNNSSGHLDLDNIFSNDTQKFYIDPPFTSVNLAPGGSIIFTLIFKPASSDIGTILNSLNFSIAPCSYDTTIALTGKISESLVHIALDSKTGKVGDNIEYKLYLRDGQAFDQSNDSLISTEIYFDGRILEFQPQPGIVLSGSGQSSVLSLNSFKANNQNSEQEIATLSFIVLPSNNITTLLDIKNTSGSGGANFIEDDGSFELIPSSAEISIDKVNGYAGQKISVPVRISNIVNIGSNNKSLNLKIKVSAMILHPLTSKKEFDKQNFLWNAEYNNLPVKTDENYILANIEFMPMLGMVESTEIIIDSVWATEGYIEFKKNNGNFSLLDLCRNRNGGPIRFFNPMANANIISLTPNPANGLVKIEYETSESGLTKIWISDILGNPVLDLVDEIPETGVNDIIFDGSLLSDGVYFIIMQTPTQIFREKIYIVR